MVTKLVMLVITTAITRLASVHTRAADELSFQSQFIQQRFSEDDMTPEFTEQLGSHDHDEDIKRKNHRQDKYVQMKNEEYSMGLASKSAIPRQIASDENKKRSMHSEEVDIVDREDHVTQYLADLLVNTDSEITSLQASDTDEEREGSEVKEDTFFAFLTGQEKVAEVEGVWSKPAPDDTENEDNLLNVLADGE